MRIFAPGSAAAHIDIDRAIANLNRKCVEIIAASGEAAAAFHVVAPSVPVTSKNAVADSPTSQWISHMRTLVIRGIDVAFVLKKGDAAAVDLYSFWSAFWYVFDFSYSNEIIRHCSLLETLCALRNFASLREPVFRFCQTQNMVRAKTQSSAKNAKLLLKRLHR